MAQFEGSDGEGRLIAHLARFYSAGFMAELRWQLGADRRLGDEAGAQARLEGFRKRFCNVSAHDEGAQGALQQVAQPSKRKTGNFVDGFATRACW